MKRASKPRAEPLQSDTVAGARAAGAALLLLAGSLALFLPGVVMYDSVGQFGQALAGEVEDWHPPAMARLWQALHAVFGGHAEPMLLLQMVWYWTGFGLIAATLARAGRSLGAVTVLGIAALPLFVGWQGVVLKDTQMLGAVLAACGCVGWWRLRGRSVPLWVLAGVFVLLGYGTLVRANAVFATVPLAVMLFGPTRWCARLGLAVVGVGLVLVLAQVVNHAVLGAERSGVERTEAFYDLSAIAAQDPTTAIALTPGEARELAARHCIKPLFWDPLGEPTRCGPTLDRLHAFKAGQLYRWLAEAIVRHPVAYATHRLGHLNSTGRWLVPAGWPSAGPPSISEPNDLGLGSPGAAAKRWQSAALWMAETPFGWPIAYVVAALTALAVALRRAASGPRDFSLALLVSALALEASFAVLSIASDLRYHLWPMLATALACILLRVEAPWPRRTVLIGGGIVALVVASGIAARVLLPAPPTSYHALLQ